MVARRCQWPGSSHGSRWHFSNGCDRRVITDIYRGPEGVCVWAPYASESVELVIGDERLPLELGYDNWWSGPDDALQHGTDYGFSIDGGPPRPAPRSRWQPEGPHGRSRWFDHSRHEWQDDGWTVPAWESAVLYELHVGTF